MIFRKAAFLFIMAVVFCNFSYAGDLASQEAIKYYDEGVQAHKINDFYKAFSAYQKALLLGIDINYQKSIINNLGVVYAQQGELEKAKATLTQVLSIDPDYKSAQFNLGLIYYIQGDTSETLKYWTKFFNIDKVSSQSFMIEEKQEGE